MGDLPEMAWRIDMFVTSLELLFVVGSRADVRPIENGLTAATGMDCWQPVAKQNKFWMNFGSYFEFFFQSK